MIEKIIFHWKGVGFLRKGALNKVPIVGICRLKSMASHNTTAQISLPGFI